MYVSLMCECYTVYFLVQEEIGKEYRCWECNGPASPAGRALLTLRQYFGPGLRRKHNAHRSGQVL